MPLQVGEFSSETGAMLEEGQIFRLDLDEAKGDNKRVMLPHPEIIEASEVGHTLLVDDGKVKLRVSGKVSLSREALARGKRSISIFGFSIRDGSLNERYI